MHHSSNRRETCLVDQSGQPLWIAEDTHCRIGQSHSSGLQAGCITHCRDLPAMLGLQLNSPKHLTEFGTADGKAACGVLLRVLILQCACLSAVQRWCRCPCIMFEVSIVSSIDKILSGSHLSLACCAFGLQSG